MEHITETRLLLNFYSSQVNSSTSEFNVFQAKVFGLVVIGENLRITAPVDHAIQRLFGGIVGERVFEFLSKAHTRRSMAGALIQLRFNQGRQRYVTQQMVSKHHFTLLHI